MDIYRRIGIVCSCIPKGKAATYGQIALLCGKPGNSRQVGYALKHGLAGKMTAAHRVVNAKGVLSGAGYFDTYDMQKLLLEKEGVRVQQAGEGWRLDLNQYGWKNTMTDVIWLQDKFREENV